MKKFENGNEKELTEKEIKVKEREMRGHMRSMERIFEIGIDSVKENQVKRIDSSLKVTNANPAPITGLLKDHKKEVSFRPVSDCTKSTSRPMSEVVTLVTDNTVEDKNEIMAKSLEEILEGRKYVKTNVK